MRCIELEVRRGRHRAIIPSTWMRRFPVPWVGDDPICLSTLNFRKRWGRYRYTPDDSAIQCEVSRMRFQRQLQRGFASAVALTLAVVAAANRGSGAERRHDFEAMDTQKLLLPASVYYKGAAESSRRRSCGIPAGSSSLTAITCCRRSWIRAAIRATWRRNTRRVFHHGSAAEIWKPVTASGGHLRGRIYRRRQSLW